MEQWKTIEGHENYQVSNLGNVKSLRNEKTRKERVLKQGLNTKGYLAVSLCLKGYKKTRMVHQLVAESFLGHKPCGYNLVVNHKDFNRQNNNVDNLEIVTARENSNQKHIKSSSEYTGVSWYEISKKWRTKIKINGKTKHLGYFKNEIEASEAYQHELKKLSL